MQYKSMVKYNEWFCSSCFRIELLEFIWNGLEGERDGYISGASMVHGTGKRLGLISWEQRTAEW